MTAKELRTGNTCVTESGAVYTVKHLFVNGRKYIPYLVKGKHQLKLNYHWNDDLTSTDGDEALNIAYVYDQYGNLLWDRCAESADLDAVVLDEPPEEEPDELAEILSAGDWTVSTNRRNRNSKADMTITKVRKHDKSQVSIVLRKPMQFDRCAILFRGDTVYLREDTINGYKINKQGKNEYLQTVLADGVQFGEYDLEYNERHNVWIGKLVKK